MRRGDGDQKGAAGEQLEADEGVIDQRPHQARRTRLAWMRSARVLKWLVVVAWLAVLFTAGPASGKLASVEKNEGAAYLPATAESTKVFDLQTRVAAEQSGAVALVVYTRPGGLTAADRLKASRDQTALAAIGQRVSTPIPSEDGQALLVTVTLKPGTTGAEMRPLVERMRQTITNDRPAGLEARVTGLPAQLADLLDAFSGINNLLLLVTISVVALILLLTYRSPLLWLVPLLTVAFAFTLANGLLYLLASRSGLVVTSQSAGILPALIFGVGTDYALLIIARYREELYRYSDRHQAMRVALRRAIGAIVASAATVIAGLLCLLAADLNSDRGLGPVGAIGILSTFLAMATLLPALLVICGRWLFWPFAPKFGAAIREDRTAWARIAQWMGARPRTVWVASAVLLLALVPGVTQMKFGLTQDGMFRTAPDSVRGQQLLAAHYPAGLSDPALVVTHRSGEAAVVAAIQQTDGVSSLLPVTRADEYVLIPVVLDGHPQTPAAERTVERLRASVHAVQGADALVGGGTAVNLDTAMAAERDQRVVISLVLVVVFVVLALLLRALIAPLLLISTVVLSYFAALGASTLLFVDAFRLQGLDYSVPLLGFVFLVALGVDYNIFLMTRVREEVRPLGHRAGVLRGLAVTGGVITSAGIVLAATFSALGILQLVALVELGILVALGVLVDTFIVRSLLVPALSLDVGPRTWWPSRLSRVTGRAGAPEGAATDPVAPTAC